MVRDEPIFNVEPLGNKKYKLMHKYDRNEITYYLKYDKTVIIMNLWFGGKDEWKQVGKVNN